MKRQFSALSVFVLALGALATQSCESTDGQNAYYNRGHYGYHDGGYVQDNGYYRNGRYAQDNGYYNDGYIGDGYQSNRPTINLHF
jgi:hypothetical protein